MQISRDWSRSRAPYSIERIMNIGRVTQFTCRRDSLRSLEKAAVRKMATDSLKITGFTISWEPQSVTIAKSGDIAYLIETSQMTMIDSLGNPETE